MRFFLNDLGVINALGTDKESVINAVLQNKTGLIQSKKLLSDRTTKVGAVLDKLPELSNNLAKYDCRNNRMLLQACLQIMSTLQSAIAKYGKSRVGIVLGTSTSGIDNGEKAFSERVNLGKFPESYYYDQQETGGLSAFLKEYLQLESVAYTISTACSSSGKTLASAKNLIQNNICDVVVVGGCDTLCELTLNGFDCLDSVSDEVCQPFSKNRKGINIGEGAALFIVSKEPSEIELFGVGESSDGYHITAPEPEGKGAQKAMKEALDMSNLKSKDIGYLNLHGTATIKNDEMESEAVANVFDNVLCSSTKSLTGHTLGAAAATELAICWLLLSQKYNPEKMLPIQSNHADDMIANIGLLTSIKSYKKPFFMSNSFAFGGNNVSVIIGKASNEI